MRGGKEAPEKEVPEKEAPGQGVLTVAQQAQRSKDNVDARILATWMSLK